MKLTAYPAFVRFWVASTVSDFGTYITAIALSVIVVLMLGGGAADVGLVSGARWLPYLLFGLLAGVWVDRFRRQQVLVVGDLGRGAILTVIAVLALTGALTVPLVVALMFFFGAISLMSDAAFQSYLPQLVPRDLLTRANARLEQSDAVAQTTGPALAGGLIQILSAPFALIVDAASYVISGSLIASIPGTTARATTAGTAVGLRHRIREGLDWVYGHARLGPLAISTHIWFVFSGMFSAVFTVYALREMGLGASGLGLVLASAGVGAVVGSSVSTRLEGRLNVGGGMILGRVLHPVAFVLIALAPTSSAWGPWLGWVMIGSGQFLFGLGLGIEGPLEMGYWQAVTPDRLMARMSATRRSINRGMIVLGAPGGGWIAEQLGNRTALWIAAGGMAVAVAVMVVSPFRGARIDESLTAEEAAR